MKRRYASGQAPAWARKRAIQTGTVSARASAAWVVPAAVEPVVPALQAVGQAAKQPMEERAASAVTAGAEQPAASGQVALVVRLAVLVDQATAATAVLLLAEPAVPAVRAAREPEVLVAMSPTPAPRPASIC